MFNITADLLQQLFGVAVLIQIAMMIVCGLLEDLNEANANEQNQNQANDPLNGEGNPNEPLFSFKFKCDIVTTDSGHPTEPTVSDQTSNASAPSDQTGDHDGSDLGSMNSNLGQATNQANIPPNNSVPVNS